MNLFESIELQNEHSYTFIAYTFQFISLTSQNTICLMSQIIPGIKHSFYTQLYDFKYANIANNLLYGFKYPRLILISIWFQVIISI